MGETLPLFEPMCNGSVKVETRPEHLTGDAGFLLLREALDRTGLIDHLGEQLYDPRKPEYIEHTMSELLRSSLVRCKPPARRSVSRISIARGSA